jgi:chemotaxis protein histidine kinase CheA
MIRTRRRSSPLLRHPRRPSFPLLSIERIGGTIDVQSKTGKGVMVRMKIPLTLAIIPALIVTSAGERYAIPQVSLLELVGLDGDQSTKGIETIHGAPVYRLRGRLLPLVHLKTALHLEEATLIMDVLGLAQSSSILREGREQSIFPLSKNRAAESDSRSRAPSCARPGPP